MTNKTIIGIICLLSIISAGFVWFTGCAEQRSTWTGHQLESVKGESDYSLHPKNFSDSPAFNLDEVRDKTGHAEQALQSAPPGGLPAAHEEIWVIVKPDSNRPPVDEALPGTGVLVGRRVKAGDDEIDRRPFKLLRTDVHASIRGHIARVGVKQKFSNPYTDALEAVYVFPLPEDAAVNEFVMTIGKRQIRGLIRDRQEAQELYAAAKAAGHTAALLTQERPNIFTQKVANIAPLASVDVDITYFHTLRYQQGEFEWVFPMVVGPRYNPASTTNGIGAVEIGDQPTRQPVNVHYTRPEHRSGQDVGLSVDVLPGFQISSLRAVNHEITINRITPSAAKVSLTSLSEIPNRDFVLRIGVAGQGAAATMLTQPGGQGGYFSLMVMPPASMQQLPRRQVEMIFVLDCSGSMNGRPLEQAKLAARRGLTMLQPGDAFQIVEFSSSSTQMAPAPIPATEASIARGINFIHNLESGGGTEMNQGMLTALRQPIGSGRSRIIVLLTDGFIGNEAEVVATMRQVLGEASVFAMGIGQSPNRYLMNRLATVGQGAVTYLGLNQNPAEVMGEFVDVMTRPALAGLQIDWADWKVDGVSPQRLPVLHAGRPVVITGRYLGAPGGAIRVQGQVAGRMESIPVTIEEPLKEKEATLSAVWARHRIAWLYDQATLRSQAERIDLPGQVKSLALNHNLMSAYTAFLAVDSATAPGADKRQITEPVAVPLPEGVNPDTTLQGAERRR